MYISRQNDLIAPLLFRSNNLHRNTGPQVSSIRKNFSKLVDSLVKSYKEGKISEEALTELLKHAASVYIESEISDRVERVFLKKGFSNKHLLGSFE